MARKSESSSKKFGEKSKERLVKGRPLRPKFLIVCEGEETEPNYFNGFHVNAEVKPKGEGYNTLSLVERARKLRQEDEYTEAWCVFDRDSFSAEQFNAALEMARKEGIKVAYSNEAFELWYLLHFAYYDTAISRHDYCAKLTEWLGRQYCKNDRKMYDSLEDRQPEAIRNAQRLLDTYRPKHNPEKDNPCTTVHLLVQELNKHIR